MTKFEWSAWYYQSMIIYADILFLMNALICYLCLLCTAFILKIPIKRLRFLFAAFIAGAHALTILFSLPPFLVAMGKVSVCLLIVFTGFGKSKLRQYLAANLVYLFLNILIAGLVLALSLADSKSFYSNMAVSYIALSPLILIAALVLCYAVMVILTKITFKRRIGGGYYRVRVEVEGEKVNLNAYCDSANHLTEPFSAYPVCVVKKGFFKAFEKKEHQRVIPFSSLAGDGLLMGIKAKITIKENGKKFSSDKVYIAESDSAFQDTPYDMLLNPKLFETENYHENQKTAIPY